MQLFWPKLSDREQVIQKLSEQTVLSPFHPDVLVFVQALSKRLIKLRQYPELVALGYWLRKANISRIQELWNESNRGQFVKPRGTVFHLAPSNVDTIFVYSWMLSLLAGNRNIIRVSSKEQPQTNELLSIMIRMMEEPEYKTVAERTVLLTYPHNDRMTAYISEYCHSRVVWGGDDTVQAIRKIPLAPMANELVFPDRFSLAILDAESVISLNEAERNNLLRQFYNDSYWFDQMACSSPKLVIWTGTDEKVKEAQYLFWSDFEKVIEKKNYELMSAVQVQKFATSLWLGADKEATKVEQGIYYSRVAFDKVPIDARERHCGGGLFYEYKANDLLEVSSFIVDKDQTLAYFGYERADLIDFASKIATRGIDRIVPIGQALNFDGIWDGQSFLESFTRKVVIL